MITNFKRNITLEIQTEIVNQLFERLKNFSEEEIKNSKVALKELEESKMMYGTLYFVFYDLVKKNFFQIEEELAEDIISIIHSFSGKLYGMRRKEVKSKIDEEFERVEL